MRLTEEQRRAVRTDESVLLEACPGSGKTRTIIAKLVRGIETVRGTPRRIACITYTNAAVQEIETRLRFYGSAGDEQYHEVSTIHTFCLSNILGRFYWRLPPFRQGFRIANPESDEYSRIATKVLDRYGMNHEALENIELLNREPDGTPIVTGGLTPDVAFEFWKSLENEGFVDFCNIVYWSYVLLVDRASIARSLSSRFSWILVDEFQDTSSLQVEILKLIAAEGRTRFFLVGDPLQSIYGFAGGRPSLMREFSDAVQASDDHRLTGNFRSTAWIIEHANRLLPRLPPMEVAGDLMEQGEEPIHKTCQTAFDGVVNVFLPIVKENGIPIGRCAILGPNWFSLFPLGRELREHGIPVFGVGARPYKRAHLFAALAEQVCSYLTGSSPEKIPHIEKELFMLLQRATGNPNYDVFSYEGRRVAYRLLRTSAQLKEQHPNAVEWLTASAREFSTILCKQGFMPESCRDLLPESVLAMRQDMIKRKVDADDLSLDELGLFADPTKNLKLLTIHAAKGREFDAVAIVDLHQGKLPHRFASEGPQFEESKRVFYVAITRARRILVYITDRSRRSNNPSCFLSEVLRN